MDLSLGPDHARFEADVRAFLAAEWPPKGSTGDDAADALAFRRKAIAAGLLYRNIPAAYGGGGQPDDPLKTLIARQAFEYAGAPGELPGIGPKMLAPTLAVRGEEWQKRRFIEPALLGEHVWCQGYSEPGAGSDLASLRTRAVLDGDHWVINGQKIWTSGAGGADYMFILVRTDPDAPKHRGISYLLLDMKAPGITIRPLKQLHGASHFNEVFFDDVRTPADWIVGQPNEGWAVTRTTLGFERAAISGPDFIDEMIARLRSYARETMRDGRPLIAHDHVIQAFGVLDGHALAHRYSVLRQVSMDAAGQDPGMATLMNKLYGTDIGLKIAELAQDLIGDGQLLAPGPSTSNMDMDWPFWILRSLGITIAGGTSNVQRNIIAERGLGLPRDAATAA